MFDEKQITGVIVSYNTKDLLKQAMDSMRRFYPEMPVILVDGSTKENPCYAYAKSLANKNTTCYSVDYNIGHGKGMHFAIEKAQTPYVLLFDSDIKVNAPCLHLMAGRMNESVYGAGMFENVQKDGYFRKDDPGGIKIPYLHPWFMLLNREMYFKFPRFIHHGSPCIQTMIEIYNQKLSEKILVEFPVGKYATHFHQGTRKTKPREFLCGWEPLSEFLTVLCRRHPKRQGYYNQHVQSLLTQSCREFHHSALCDFVGQGVPFANGMLAKALGSIIGEYVFILDDDDVMIDDDFVADMKAIAQEHDPDVIMVRMYIRDKLYPTEEVWNKKPKFAHIGMSNFVVKKHVYEKHAAKFNVPRGADFSFIDDVFKQNYKIYWQDKVYSKTITVSRGKAEPGAVVIPIKNTIPTVPNKVTIITCTGDRSEAFALCKTWVQQQSLQPDQWIVVDDGKAAMKEVPDCTYIRRDPSKNDPKHTLSLNLIEALLRVQNEKVMFFEDDDWYRYDYIQQMSDLLNGYMITGVRNLIFYHVGIPGWNKRMISKRPALFQTVFRSELIDHFMRICRTIDKGIQQKGLIDLKLWDDIATIENKGVVVVQQDTKTIFGMIKKGQKFHSPFPNFINRMIEKNLKTVEYKKEVIEKHLYMSDDVISIGIKGMPGRKGLTQAQMPLQNFYKYDSNCTYLKKMIGNDFQHYERFVKK